MSANHSSRTAILQALGGGLLGPKVLGVAGSTLGALLGGPSGAATGSTVGASLGSIIGPGLANEVDKRIPEYNFNLLQMRAGLIDGRWRIGAIDKLALLGQLRVDFDNAVDISNPTRRFFKTEVRERAKLANPDASLFFDDLENLRLEDSVAAAPSIYNMELAKLLLNRIDRRLNVSCVAGQAAVIAALKYMEGVMKIPLALDFLSPGGPDLVEKTFRSIDTWNQIDYIFTTTADLLMAKEDNTSSIIGLHDYYGLVAPIHQSRQFVVRPKNGVRHKLNTVRYNARGTAEEQFKCLKAIEAPFEGVPYSKHNIKTISMSLEENEAFLMWEGSIYPFKQTGRFHIAETKPYNSWICLFSRRHRHDGDELDWAFNIIFREAWKACSSSFTVAEDMVTIPDALSSFRSAAQLRPLAVSDSLSEAF